MLKGAMQRDFDDLILALLIIETDLYLKIV